MRDRHIPRLCRSCSAPMARQQDSCWRCSAEWSSPAEPETVAATLLRNELDARVSAERWVDEGGSYAEPPVRQAVGAA